jgi:hypothetical protein
MFVKFAVLGMLMLSSFSAFSVDGKPQSSFGTNVLNKNITAAEVEAAQRAWGEALIKISTTFDNKGLKQATKVANEVLDGAYGYNLGTVLFKPTLTHGEQTFRPTREGALAYFVGGNKNFPQDKGFALKGWREYTFNNSAVYINGNNAITMGKVNLVDKDGKVTTVDKTWGYLKDEKGQLRIILHHSSLPYKPLNETAAN